MSRLELLGRAYGDEIAVNHGADSRAEQLNLVHGIGCHEHGAPTSGVLRQLAPYDSPSRRVDALRRTIQQKKRGTTDERDGERELTLL